MALQTLPTELLIEIGERVFPESTRELAATCKRVRSASSRLLEEYKLWQKYHVMDERISKVGTLKKVFAGVWSRPEEVFRYVWHIETGWGITAENWDADMNDGGSDDLSHLDSDPGDASSDAEQSNSTGDHGNSGVEQSDHNGSVIDSAVSQVDSKVDEDDPDLHDVDSDDDDPDSALHPGLTVQDRDTMRDKRTMRKIREMVSHMLPNQDLRKLCKVLYKMSLLETSTRLNVAFTLLLLLVPNLRSLRTQSNETNPECLSKLLGYIHSNKGGEILNNLSTVEIVCRDHAGRMREFQLFRSLPALTTLRMFNFAIPLWKKPTPDDRRNVPSNVQELELTKCGPITSHRSHSFRTFMAPMKGLRKFAASFQTEDIPSKGCIDAAEALRIVGESASWTLEFLSLTFTGANTKWDYWKPLSELKMFANLREIEIDAFLLAPQLFRQGKVGAPEGQYRDDAAKLHRSKKPATPLVDLLPPSIEILRVAVCFRPQLHGVQNERVKTFFDGMQGRRRDEKLPNLKEVHLHPLQSEDHSVLRDVCPTNTDSGIAVVEPGPLVAKHTLHWTNLDGRNERDIDDDMYMYLYEDAESDEDM